jgi:ATP-binding cassette subfamily F protein uup
VTQVIAAEGDGRWGEYAGGYADWQRVKQREAEAAGPARGARPAAPRAEQPVVPAARPAKLSFNERRELDALPERIAALETEQAAIHGQLADPGLYQQAPQELPRLNARLAFLEAELETALERWEELETRAAGT